MPFIARNVILLQLGRDALEPGLIWHTDQNEIGNAFIGAAQAREIIDGMVRLNDLMAQRNILPNEDIDVLLNRRGGTGQVNL